MMIFRSFYQALEAGIYQEKNYEVALGKVNEQLPTMNKILRIIEKTSPLWDWGIQKI